MCHIPTFSEYLLGLFLIVRLGTFEEGGQPGSAGHDDHDVVPDGDLVEESDFLESAGKTVVRGLEGVNDFEALAIDNDHAAVEGEGAGEEINEGGLPRAVGPYDTGHARAWDGYG